MPSKKTSIERRLNSLEGDGEGDEEPPAYVFLEELRDGTCPPGTPSVAEMLSGQSNTDLLVDTRDTGEGDQDREAGESV